MKHHTAPRAEKPRRPFLVTLVSIVGVLVGSAAVIAIIAGVFIGGLVNSFTTESETITNAFPDTARPDAATGAMNVLLIGSDDRSSLDPDGDQVNGGRSDTLMLVNLPADRQSVHVMSIMRDSWVDVPGHGEAKINAAYSWGGVALTVDTVEQLLDVRIDHVAEIDFAGFQDMTDALGGVTAHSTADFTARGHHFTQGPNTLDGDAALAFVRERASFADADYTRVRHQQAFMRGLIDKVLSKSTLTNPGRVADFVNASSTYLAVDNTLDLTTLGALAWDLRNLPIENVKTFTLPTISGGLSADGQSYVSVDKVAQETLTRAFRADDLDSWLEGTR